MLGVTAVKWWLGVGGACQFFGVVLLIVGLSKTRRAFDTSRAGLAVASVKAVRDARHRAKVWLAGVWARVAGHPKRRDARVTPAPVEAKASVVGGLVVTPPLDKSDPVAAIHRVHELVYEVRESLLGEIGTVRRRADALVREEAETRVTEEGRLRDDLSNLAVGGLANEAWASVLILAGVAITTVASLLA